MEFIKCILCNKDDSRLLVTKKSFNIVKCNICDLVYLNPRMDEDELASLYNTSEDQTSRSIADSQRYAGHDAHKIKKFNTAIRLLKKHKKDINNVFDLGCSTGIFLDLVANQGWTPYGSDLNRNLIEANQKKYGKQIKLQTGNQIDFPDQHFDVITLFDSIEHMPDPLITLKEIMRVMKDDGLVIISTPNVGGLFPVFTYAVIAKTFGAWEHPTPPGHVFQFSKCTLLKLLEKSGLESIGVRTYEIFKPYTVSQLENSIIDVMKRNNHKTNKLYQKADVSKASDCDFKYKGSNPLAFINKMPRLLIRGFSLILVNTIYPLAKLFKSGDAMIVIAKKINYIEKA